jgi:hypothetical protein
MKRRAHSAAVALLTAALASASSTAAAPVEKSTAHLVYDRGDLSQCPEEAEVRDAVAARLGYDPFDPSSHTTVTAVIMRDQARLRAHIELRNPNTGASGRRELTSAQRDCTELASAMTLAISIAIDPRSLTRPAGTPAARELPAPMVPPAAPPPHEDVQVLPRGPTPRDGVHVVGGGLGSLAYGMTPSATVAPVLFAGVRVGRLSVRVEGRFYAPTAEEASPTGSVRGSILGGALSPCVHFGVGVGCAVLLLGSFHGEGRGVDVPQEQSALYAASGLRIGLELPLARHLFVPLYAEGLVPITREELRLRDQVVWHNPAVTLAVMLGLGAHFF